MGLAFRFHRQQHQFIVQRCSTCKQSVGRKPDAEATSDVNLCGAEKYVACPTCKKVVPEELRAYPRTPAVRNVTMAN
jgi:uncharacterized protein with PIN domain